jgi:hypothetical protein
MKFGLSSLLGFVALFALVVAFGYQLVSLRREVVEIRNEIGQVRNDFRGLMNDLEQQDFQVRRPIRRELENFERGGRR